MLRRAGTQWQTSQFTGHTGGVLLELRGFAARLVLHVDLEGQDALLLAVRVPEVLGWPKQEAGVGKPAGENLHKGRPRPQEVCVHQACSMHPHLRRCGLCKYP